MVNEVMGEKEGYGQPKLPDLSLKSYGDIYHKMVEEVEDYAIIFLDIEGRIQNWNRGAEKIKQYTEVEAVGMSFKMFYLPEDRERHLPERMLEQAKDFGRAIHEGWRIRKDGTRFWGIITLTALHDNGGDIIGFSKVTRDLTERKISEDSLRDYTASLEKSNEELRKSEERFQRMIAEVQDYAIILLNENGDIQNWNAGVQKIKGYTAQEIIGKNFKIFYLPEDQESGLPEKLIAEAANKGKATHEGWRVKSDGGRFWGSIVITALHKDTGELIGFSKVTRDLTERKLAEERQQKYLLALEAQNRELERFAYVASHDLQEPLRKIRIFIDVIGSNLRDEELISRMFVKINRSAERMSELIRAILDYSWLGKDNMRQTEIDLNKLLKSVIDDFELSIQEKDATVWSEEIRSIRGCELQIGQVFSNLIGNALKFSREKPEIRISSKIVHSDVVSDWPNYLVKGNYLEIVFADNGIGFEQQYAKQIFLLFQRLHGKHEFSGTGIGLALCKRIMENHGGYISAWSEPGYGTRFHIYLPV
jgi:PAS domain S-box-containing protein